MNKKKVLVIAQLALGDSIILRRRFLKTLESYADITILCNSYNSFIFEGFKLICEDWPISRRKSISFKKVNANEFDDIILPSGHLKEKLFARIRLPFNRLTLPVSENFQDLQRSNFQCLPNVRKIKLNNPSNWFESYFQCAIKYLELHKIIRSTDKSLNPATIKYEHKAMICPYSRGSGSYKNIPTEFLKNIINTLLEKGYVIYFVSDDDEGYEIKNIYGSKLIYLTPRNAYQNTRHDFLKIGFFAESFFNQLMHGYIENQYTYFTRIDKFHPIAAPPGINIFYDLNDIKLDLI